MNNDWHNNLISKRLDKEYPHDFSICDIDGVTRVFYNENNNWKDRLIIYESKYYNETASQQQLETLFLLDNAINWSKFDDKSGLYLIKHNDNANYLEIYNINKTYIKEKEEYRYNYEEKVEEMDIDKFYELVSAQDKGDDK